MSVIHSYKPNFRGNFHLKEGNMLASMKSVLGINPEEFITLESVPAIVLDVVRDESHPQIQNEIIPLNADKTPPDYNDQKHIVRVKDIEDEIEGVSSVENYDKDMSWVGRCHVRLLMDDLSGGSKALTTWAYPLDNNIKEYPLLNEIVVVTKYFNNKYFYSRKLNIKNLINHNAYYSSEFSNGKAELVNNPNPDGAEKSSFLFELPQDSDPDKGDISSGFLGSYFKENHKLRPLQHFEGDTIIEGRNGNSIRFGGFVNNIETDSGWPDGSYPQSKNNPMIGSGNPMILIRNRQKPDASQFRVFGQPILEDINQDGSSIHITSGATISDYKVVCTKTLYGQEEQPDFAGDAPPFPTLNGNQIVVQSDRLVFSSRLNETFFYAKQRYSIVTDDIYTCDAQSKIAITTNSSYHLKAHDRIDVKTHSTTTWESNKDILHLTKETSTWNSQKQITHQTPEEYTINSHKKVILNSPEIYLGKGDETDEPVLMGSTTMIWVADLIYEILWRLKYKVDSPPPPPPPKGDVKEYIHYKFKDKIMEDMMRQAPNCISRKVFVSGHDTSPGVGKMKRKPHSSPFTNMVKGGGSDSGGQQGGGGSGGGGGGSQPPSDAGSPSDLPPSDQTEPTDAFSAEGTPSDNTNQALLNSAKGMVGENTSNLAGAGSLSCAASVNEMSKRAFGEPICNSASTADMYQALKSGKGTMVPIDKAPPGSIIISPTSGGNTGHVGILGEGGKIISNSSSAKAVKQNFTTQSWNNYYSGKKGLPTYAFVLNKSTS